jgi:hypothetical protein
MYTTDTRSRFIELRGRGLSYDKISRHLGVAKSTLVAWNRLYAPAIQELYNRELHTASNHAANETYWHPMHAARHHRRKRSLVTTRSAVLNLSGVKSCARRFLRSPFVRILIRWAAFKH